ncbi:MAG: hypothetical protein ABI175_11720 [Polyangiales bacterium]
MRVLLLLVLAACGAKHSPIEVGATPPAITLTNTANARVALADVTATHAQTIVVFYRGFF